MEGSIQEGSVHNNDALYTSRSSVLGSPVESAPLLASCHGDKRRHSLSDNSSIDSSSRTFEFDLDREKKRCKKMFYNRIPKGKAAFLVFVINVLETIAFYGSLSIVQFALLPHFSSDDLNGQKSFLVYTILLNTAGRVLYPVGGLIADVYLGRYRVIQIGLWFYWIGLAILLMFLALHDQIQSSQGHLNVKLIMPIIAAIFIVIGSASVEPTIIAFGMDQIQQGASSDELSSYFSWFYFGRNFGYVLINLCSLAFVVSSVYVQYLSPGTFKFCIIGAIAIVVVTIAMLLHYCLQHWYYKARRMNNPVKSICNVLFFVATVKRQPPRYRKSFRYGEGKKSRMDLAKIEYDGIYSSEEVEDVKTFFRVLLVIIALGGYFITYGALSNTFSVLFQKNSTVITYRSEASSLYFLIESGMVILFIPFLNHFILPCYPGASMKRRIGVGVFFNFLCALIGMVIQLELYRITKQTIWLWLIIPIIFLAIGDMLIFVTGLEFIYAQSPNSMKSVLTGLFYFVYGVFFGVGTLIFHVFDDSDHDIYIFYTVLAISGVGFIVYGLVAYFYRNRQRPTNDESEQDLVHRSYAASVYLSGNH